MTLFLCNFYLQYVIFLLPKSHRVWELSCSFCKHWWWERKKNVEIRKAGLLNNFSARFLLSALLAAGGKEICWFHTASILPSNKDRQMWREMEATSWERRWRERNETQMNVAGKFSHFNPTYRQLGSVWRTEEAGKGGKKTVRVSWLERKTLITLDLMWGNGTRWGTRCDKKDLKKKQLVQQGRSGGRRWRRSRGEGEEEEEEREEEWGRELGWC